MAAVIPPLYVENPHPQTQRYGLFDVAVGPLDLPEHARNGGVDYESIVCELPTGYAVACTPDMAVKTFGGGPETVTAAPFVVRSSFRCGSVGMTEERMRQLAITRLKAGEMAVVERIFSQATFGQTPGLPGATVVTPDCTDLVTTVGALEEAFYATRGNVGVLHVPMVAGVALLDQRVIERDGRIWRTASGTAVSIGNYINASPADPQVAAGAGQAWLYMTGSVAVWRSPDSSIYVPKLAEALNRSTNQVYGQAEREYIVSYECDAYAALSTLCVV